MDGGAEAERDLRAQLRLAVVMTGGVSLCVWMGGVTLELDRLCRERPGSMYDELCRLAGVRPVVDIVSGTSAGGLNGTLLASANAWRSDLEDLRQVWLGTADMAALLRKAGASASPSLLDGDGYLLPHAHEAISHVHTKGATTSGTGAARARAGLPPVHLTVTSTLMQGNTVNFVDTLGSPVNSTTYLGLYRFSTDKPAPDQEAPFDRAKVVGQLARAARSSASFPVAFEASRIDTGRGDVDMGPVADFTNPGGPDTRYVLDGGLVDNEPIDQVYDLIRDQPSDAPVRRVLCFVSPLSGAADAPAPPVWDRPAPDLLDVVSDTINLPREQNIVRQLRAVLDRSDDHRAASRARRDLIVDHRDVPAMLRAAETLQTVIDRQRGELVVAAAQLRAGTALDLDPDSAGQREARRQALLLVQDLLRRAIVRATDDKSTDRDDRTALADQRKLVSDALVSPLLDDAAVQELVAASYDLVVARVPSVASRVGASPAPDAPVNALVEDLRRLQALVEAAADSADTLAADRVGGSETDGTGIDRSDEPGPGAERPTGDGDGGRHAVAVWRAVRALDVLLTASSSSVAPNPQRIDLVQLSAYTGNCFDGRSTAETKLTGVQFNHFGAFYRCGWRANDWMWGRLDGAMRIVELLVDPDTLLATGKPIADLSGRLYELATGPSADVDHEWLTSRPELVNGRGRIEELLTTVARAEDPDHHRVLAAETRRQIARMVAPRLQLQILREELAVVRACIKADVEGGAAAHPCDTLFLEMSEHLDERSPAGTVVNAFQFCRVGEDRLGAEFGSDRLTTLGTQALSVATGAIEQVAVGRRFEAAKTVLTPLRWAFRMANNLTSNGFLGSQLAKVALPTIAVLTAALMAVAVWSDRSGSVQLVLGILLAGLSVAAVVSNLDSGKVILGAFADIVVLVVGLLLVKVDWAVLPFVGTALAVVAAAVLAALVLRKPSLEKQDDKG